MPDSATPKGRDKRALRRIAHHLDPVVTVAERGVSDAVCAETDRALTDHELIKVRMREPDDKKAMAAQLAADTKAALCGLVGHTVILYRAHPEEPVIELPSRSVANPGQG